MKQTNKALKAKIQMLELELERTNQKYQGYSNKETWTTCLMLKQERTTSNEWRTVAAAISANADSIQPVMDGIWTREQGIKFELADRLKNRLENAMESEQLNMDPLFQSLLRDAFENVNWDEVAEEFLESR